MIVGVGDRISLNGQVYDVKTVSPDWMASLTSGVQNRDKDDFESGDVRMDLETKRLIRLNCSLMTEEELWDRDDMEDMPWLVEDILSGQVYTRNDSRISMETFNAMETLGWASEDHPDVEIEGD